MKNVKQKEKEEDDDECVARDELVEHVHERDGMHACDAEERTPFERLIRLQVGNSVLDIVELGDVNACSSRSSAAN
jgi:hypothetical protein